MGRLRTQDYVCVVCGHHSVEFIELPHDVEFRMESCPALHCPHCRTSTETPAGWSMFPRPGAPALMQRALPDGTKRDDIWKLTREISERRSESYDRPPDKRGELNSEMSRLEGEIRRRGLRDRFDDGRKR